MAKFIITTDSACDWALEELKQNNIPVIFYKYSDGTNFYKDDMNIKSYKKVYFDMKKGAFFKTSQINPQEYYDFFKPLLEEKLPILHVSLGSGVSNTINSVFIATNMLKEDNPDCEIIPIDSKMASLGMTLLLKKLIDYRERGLTVSEAVEKINYYVDHLNTLFTTDTLTYFARGGRLSKVGAFLGNAFKINPVLDTSPSGHLRIVEKVRGERRALDHLINRLKDRVINPTEQIVYICHADSDIRANELGNRLVKEVGFKDYKCYLMGPIIGAHTGPGLLSVYFFGKKREDHIKSLAKDEVEKVSAKPNQIDA